MLTYYLHDFYKAEFSNEIEFEMGQNVDECKLMQAKTKNPALNFAAFFQFLYFGEIVFWVLRLYCIIINTIDPTPPFVLVICFLQLHRECY